MTGPGITDVVNALLAGDQGKLSELRESLRVSAGDDRYMEALHDVAYELAERLPTGGDRAFVDADPHGKLLRELVAGPRSSDDLCSALGIGRNDLAAAGRVLLGVGLAVVQRAGDLTMWELSPRGRQVLPLADIARTFLASIASAQSQGTREQTDWMIAQAREGLRRAGGHDFDASGDYAA